MGNCCPLLTRLINVLGRNEIVPGTAETLNANDGKMRIFAGAQPEYVAPREKLDYARKSLTPLGSLEGTKVLNNAFRVPMNTRDTIEKLANLDIDTILFQSAIACGAGAIIRITFSGSPVLTGVNVGEFLDVNYATNSSNDGSFQIQSVNSGSFYVDIVNRGRSDNADDEAAASPAVGDIQNPVEMQWAINSCLAKVRGISRIAIGAVGVSSFERNETITGGTSSGTARVIVPAEDGDSYIYFEPLTGMLQTGEVLTGGTSGATATSSSAPGVHGHFIKPLSNDSCDAEVSTINFQNNGYHWEARSSMGNMTFEAAANKAMFLDFAMQGPKNDIGDEAMLTVTRDNEDPPIVKTAELKLDAFSPVFATVNFDMGNVIALRENGNAEDDSGIESARVTDRESKVTINLEHELAATFDFFDKLDNGTKVALQMHAGTVLDKTCWFFADALEFDALPLGDKDGIRMLELSAMCTGSADSSNDDWEFALI
jgi:hypothetical protein